MNHFEHPHLRTRKPPKSGETVWLVPIRYWEPDDYKPESMIVEEVTKDGNFYGFHHGYGHKVYVSVFDAKWYYSEELARKAQLAFAHIDDLIMDDEATYFTKEVFKKARSRKKAK